MHRRHFLAGLGAATLAPTIARAIDYGSDIGWLIDVMAKRYAYLPDRHVDLDKLRDIYVPKAQAVSDDRAFLGVLESVLAEFHDHHIETNTNNPDSPQLVPTSAEIWASFRDSEAIVEDVRPGSSLAAAGLRAGHRILTIGGVPVRNAVAAAAPQALASPDPEADDYTLRVLLAGTHRARRVFSFGGRDGIEHRVDLPPHERPADAPLLTLRHVDLEIAWLRIGNSLGDTALVAAFDKALDDVRDTRGLILDLRDTPSGGNTDVAEPILGRFVNKKTYYQRQFAPGPGKVFPQNSTQRWVRPRGPFEAKNNLVVLCDRWTGSMGEGMTIGFDAMGRAAIVGTRMAGLCGATEGVTLPASGIGVHFPTLRLYHLNGTPRERFVPHYNIDLASAEGEDPILARGIAVLREMPR
jgi:carboxyl-terminal processing protease